MTVICATCAVEHAEPLPPVCAICADERQWVPAEGQRWVALGTLRSAGQRVDVSEVEPGLHGLRAEPKVGIGQQALLATTPAGNVLWDPVGYVDDDAVASVRARGEVVAIAASHPHMFGAQVEWSRALGGPPVLVCAADRGWVARPDPVIAYWSGATTPVPGLSLHQIGGHFPGSAVALWSCAADGRGVLFSGDTVFPGGDRRSVAFMRSYPNHLPLSARVADRIATSLEALDFDRLYGNFGGVVPQDAKGVVRWSADRHRAWVSGEHDDET